MLFNSWEFLVLCVVTLGLYYFPLVGGKVWQVTVLLVASGIFYAWEEPRLLFLLSASCLLNALAVERILFWKKQEEGGSSSLADGRGKKWVFWTVFVDLGFLAFF